jgi:hypothetical protein
MVIQAIALLDDLDKEINIYSMRVKVSANCRVFDSTAPLLTPNVSLGMVRMAFPGNGQDHRR